MEAIFANEEEHAEDMKTILEAIGREEKQQDHQVRKDKKRQEHR